MSFTVATRVPQMSLLCTIAKATGYHPQPDISTILLKTQLMYAIKGEVKLVLNKKIHCY